MYSSWVISVCSPSNCFVICRVAIITNCSPPTLEPNMLQQYHSFSYVKGGFFIHLFCLFSGVFYVPYHITVIDYALVTCELLYTFNISVLVTCDRLLSYRLETLYTCSLWHWRCNIYAKLGFSCLYRTNQHH